MSTATLVPTTSTDSPVRLDTVLEILGDAATTAQTMNGKGPTGAGAERRATEAECSRTLLNLADQLMLASTLVRNEYWSAKGHTSYDL